jgi:hypothetical protein
MGLLNWSTGITKVVLGLLDFLRTFVELGITEFSQPQPAFQDLEPIHQN